jgi:hypothetical protein
MSRRIQFSLGRLMGSVGWCAVGSLFGSALAGEPLDLLRIPAVFACCAAAGACYCGRAIHSLLIAIGIFATFMVGFGCLVALLLLLPH